MSRVKTEFYFRQVLGRILRISSAPNQEAWLFTLAEEKLSIFANRIGQELPDMGVLVRSNVIGKEYGVTRNDKRIKAPSANTHLVNEHIEIGDFSLSDKFNDSFYQNRSSSASLDTFGGFRQKLIEAFASI